VERLIKIEASTLLIVLLILSYCLPTGLGKSLHPHPMAIGFSRDERYILFSDNAIYRVLSNGSLELFAHLPETINLSGYTLLDFSVVGDQIVFYLYKTLNASRGYTRIFIVNRDGEPLYDEVFEFSIVNGSHVYGGLISVAAATTRGLAIMISNDTSSYILVYERSRDGFKLEKIYSGVYTFTLYIYGDSIVGVVPYTTISENRTTIVLHLVDLFTNESIFEIPSLIPVIPFATPIVQVFRNRNDWIIHVTVVNRIINRMEYYITKPSSYELRDSLRASFSPTMDCAVLETVNGSAVVLSDGTMYFLNKYIPIAPRQIYMAIDPPNAVLDADVSTRRVLIKYSSGNKTSIYILQNNELLKIYELPAEYSYKVNGFYAALKGDYALIVDPQKHELVKIDLKTLQNPSRGTDMKLYIYTTVAAVSTASVAIIMLKYRRHKSRT